MKKVAFLLKGAVSKVTGKFDVPQSVYKEGDYVNFHSTFHSIKRHILDCNPNYQVDFFIHSWNTDLEEDLVKIYNPKKYLFEDNDLYQEEMMQKLNDSGSPINHFSQISQCLSIKKGCDLISNEYDLVVIYRLDLLLWKNMYFDEYDPSQIYTNHYGNCDGDFHFVMNYQNMLEFKNAYDSISSQNRPEPHHVIKRYVINFLGKSLSMDSISAGVHQEVTRKLFPIVECGNITLEQLEEYGINKQKVFLYNS